MSILRPQEIVSYIEGMGIDRHLARVANGNTVAYVTDALGTVRTVVGASGVALNSYTFKAYGETRDKTEGAENSYLYTGRRLESDTGDYYYRARYYLPQQGMFGAVDRYVPDEMTFAYAGGNPVMMVDPSGELVNIIFDRGTGILTIVDKYTGKRISTKAKSGGWCDDGHFLPIPTGEWDILDQVQNPDFFRLDPVDECPRNDIHEPTGRTLFRLHGPGRRNYGCLEVLSEDQWTKIHSILSNTKTVSVSDNLFSWIRFWKGFKPRPNITKYGRLKVCNTKFPPSPYPPPDHLPETNISH